MSEPILYLFAFGAGLGPMIGAFEYQGSTLTYAQFLGPGMIAVAVLFQSFLKGLRQFYSSEFPEDLAGAAHGALELYRRVFGRLAVGDHQRRHRRLRHRPGGRAAGALSAGGAALCAAGDGAGRHALRRLRPGDRRNSPHHRSGQFADLFIHHPDVRPERDVLSAHQPAGVSRYFAEILPLAPVVDFLRWPYGLPSYWPWQLAGLIVLIAVAGSWAWWAIRRRIYL